MEKKEVKGKEGKEKGGKGTKKYGNWRKEKTGRENSRDEIMDK